MSKKAQKILLVDDEKDILDFVGYNLRKEGYEVHTALDGEQALEMATDLLPDLIILDVMMPGLDGIEVCRRLRSQDLFKDSLIVFLTARGEDYTEIVGFDVGADDFIAKPIRLRVLLARIKAMMKRKKASSIIADQIIVGDLLVDLSARSVYIADKEIHLPKKEFKLLELMVSSPGRIFNRDELYLKVWGSDVIVGERTLDVHILKIREKIGKGYIITKKGIGYGFNDKMAKT